MRPIDRKERRRLCYCVLSEAGCPEAVWMLADMYHAAGYTVLARALRAGTTRQAKAHARAILAPDPEGTCLIK